MATSRQARRDTRQREILSAHVGCKYSDDDWSRMLAWTEVALAESQECEKALREALEPLHQVVLEVLDYGAESVQGEWWWKLMRETSDRYESAKKKWA